MAGILFANDVDLEDDLGFVVKNLASWRKWPTIEREEVSAFGAQESLASLVPKTPADTWPLVLQVTSASREARVDAMDELGKVLVGEVEWRVTDSGRVRFGEVMSCEPVGLSDDSAWIAPVFRVALGVRLRDPAWYDRLPSTLSLTSTAQQVAVGNRGAKALINVFTGTTPVVTVQRYAGATLGTALTLATLAADRAYKIDCQRQRIELWNTSTGPPTYSTSYASITSGDIPVFDYEDGPTIKLTGTSATGELIYWPRWRN